MNQPAPPASTQIPLDLAVFRSPDEVADSPTSLNFAPGSRLELLRVEPLERRPNCARRRCISKWRG
jgi:hypothetical protein